MNYFKILVFLQKGDRGDFDTPVEEQHDFLHTLPEPHNDIDRGYNQYLCQNFFVAKWKRLLFNIVSFPSFPAVALYYLLKRMFVHKGDYVGALIENKGMEEVVPEVVRTKYAPTSKYWAEGASLSINDISFLFKLIRKAPDQPFFAFKSMMNVARYSDMIKRHKPRVMIQFGEFSFSSSILTAYCHSHEIKHIDIMHGEKVYCIKDAFHHYDECYVWSEFYINLFLSLRAAPGQHIVALPPSMQIMTEQHKNVQLYADYKYYLETYSEAQIQSIILSMQFAKNLGNTVKYRPHPRYSDVALLRKYVTEEEIEYPNEVPIVESISNTQNVVGLFTTVLAQAYYSGVNVIMDDMTYKQFYDNCLALKYMLVEKVQDTLSKHQ
jgi:hypothetical protein